MSQNIIKTSDFNYYIKRMDLVLDNEKGLERDHINGCLIRKFVCFYNHKFEIGLKFSKIN